MVTATMWTFTWLQTYIAAQTQRSIKYMWVKIKVLKQVVPSAVNVIRHVPCHNLFNVPAIAGFLYKNSKRLKVVTTCTPNLLDIWLNVIGGPKWITWRTLGQSIPIPNATVATTIRNVDSLVNKDTMSCLTTGLVQLMYMSTSLNRGKLGAPGVLVKFTPR